MRDVQTQAKDMRRRVRVQRKASMLGWLEASMLGHRMPSAAGLIADAQWKRDEINAYCWRCATTRAPFEDLERGCAECRDRSLGIHGVAFRATVRLGRYAPPLSQWVPAIKQRAWRDMGITLGRELGMQVVDALTEGKLARPDVVVAVPVHWARRMLRGIDHCQIIAEEVARLTGLPMASPLRARLALRQTRVGFCAAVRLWIGINAMYWWSTMSGPLVAPCGKSLGRSSSREPPMSPSRCAPPRILHGATPCFDSKWRLRMWISSETWPRIVRECGIFLEPDSGSSRRV